MTSAWLTGNTAMWRAVTHRARKHRTSHPAGGAATHSVKASHFLPFIWRTCQPDGGIAVPRSSDSRRRVDDRSATPRSARRGASGIGSRLIFRMPPGRLPSVTAINYGIRWLKTHCGELYALNRQRRSAGTAQSTRCTIPLRRCPLAAPAIDATLARRRNHRMAKQTALARGKRNSQRSSSARSDPSHRDCSTPT